MLLKFDGVVQRYYQLKKWLCNVLNQRQKSNEYGGEVASFVSQLGEAQTGPRRPWESRGVVAELTQASA